VGRAVLPFCAKSTQKYLGYLQSVRTPMSAMLVPNSVRTRTEFYDRSSTCSTATGPALDELVELAAQLCGADFAYVGWMDSSRLWFKSRYGFEGFEQPREAAACSGARKGRTAVDQRCRRRPAIYCGWNSAERRAACRSYLGTPLISSSQQVIGTLAVLAREPGRFTPQQISLMEKLGRPAVTRLELYGRILLQEQAQRMRQRTERALAIERCFVTATLDSIPRWWQF